MAKKNKKSDSNDLLYQFDSMLDQSYLGLMEEIEMYQAEIERADRKAKSKASKRFNGKEFYPYEYQLHAREHVVQEMLDASFFDRIMKTLTQLAPVVVIIARLIAALIVSILSVTTIKGKLSKDTLAKLQEVYNVAMAIG